MIKMRFMCFNVPASGLAKKAYTIFRISSNAAEDDDDDDAAIIVYSWC